MSATPSPSLSRYTSSNSPSSSLAVLDAVVLAVPDVLPVSEIHGSTDASHLLLLRRGPSLLIHFPPNDLYCDPQTFRVDPPPLFVDDLVFYVCETPRYAS